MIRSMKRDAAVLELADNGLTLGHIKLLGKAQRGSSVAPLAGSMKSPPSDPQTQGPHDPAAPSIHMDLGRSDHQGSGPHREATRPLTAQYRMHGFICSRLSFDFLDHHTFSALMGGP